MKNTIVYMHKNKINGKVYIGITSTKCWERWGRKGQRYCQTDTKFSNAIKKYGFDNFEHIILFENLSHEDAATKEKELISLYDSFKNGYNSTLGGDGGGFINHHNTKESILKSVHFGKDNGMYGKTRDEYVREAVRKAQSIPVYQYDLNYNLINIYKSGYDVMRKTGFDNSYIAKKCKKKGKAYGFIWSYNKILPPTTTE